MPEIAIQTDECVDVISQLNDEYDTLDIENFKIRQELEEYKELIKKIAAEVCEPNCKWNEGSDNGCWIQNIKCRCRNSQHSHKIKKILSLQ